MAESPPSANVGWSMSYRRFSPSAGYQLHKPPLSVSCALGETTSANCVSFRLICNPHSTGYPTGLVPTLHPHLCTTLDSSYIWDTMVNLVHLQLMYVNMCFMKPSLTVWNQGIQTTQAKAKAHLPSRKTTQSKSVKAVEKVLDSPLEDSADLPGISDVLFDFTEPSLDQSAQQSRRTCTSPSENPLLTAVHHTGVFDLEVLYCISPNAAEMDEQLLHTQMFPSSFINTETVFTTSVLDEFLMDNLECKTTAQQYFSTLQSITNQMFPDTVLVCSTCHLQDLSILMI